MQWQWILLPKAHIVDTVSISEQGLVEIAQQHDERFEDARLVSTVDVKSFQVARDRFLEEYTKLRDCRGRARLAVATTPAAVFESPLSRVLPVVESVLSQVKVT